MNQYSFADFPDLFMANPFLVNPYTAEQELPPSNPGLPYSLTSAPVNDPNVLHQNTLVSENTLTHLSNACVSDLTSDNFIESIGTQPQSAQDINGHLLQVNEQYWPNDLPSSNIEMPYNDSRYRSIEPNATYGGYINHPNLDNFGFSQPFENAQRNTVYAQHPTPPIGSSPSTFAIPKEVSGKKSTKKPMPKKPTSIKKPSPSKVHECKDCGKMFSKRNDRTRHINSVHRGNKDFVCDTCGKCFARKDSLDRHKNKRKFACKRNTASKLTPYSDSRWPRQYSYHH